MTTDRQSAEQEAAVAHMRDLLEAHYREAEESADEDGKFSIGFRVTFDRSYDPMKLKVTCRIAKTITDEVESEVEDPRQQTLL